MTQKIKITSPVFVVLPRKTKKDRVIYLNLNVYRNLHYIVNNKTKVIYFENIKKQIKGVRLKTPIDISFYLFKNNRREVDRSNVLSVIDKFFCDSLVKAGCIPDDNDSYIKATHYYTGGISPGNSRVEIIICQSS